MMQDIFIRVLGMSMIGCYSALVVLAARRLLWKCERKYSYYLWIIVFMNLCIPFSVKGSFSLIPKQVAEFSTAQNEGMKTNISEKEMADNIFLKDGLSNQSEKGQASNQTGDLGENSALAAWHRADAAAQGKNGKAAAFIATAAYVWIMGAAVIILVNVAGYARLKKRICQAEIICWNPELRTCETDFKGGAFVLGLFRPIVYLPAGMTQEEKSYIIEHELYHRRRRDYLLKPAAFCVTAVHWFNPLAWLAYLLFVQDMEVSCDESVLSGRSGKVRRQYAESLLKFAAAQSGFAFTPLNFGKPALESRIKNVLREKKKSVIFTFAAVIGALLVALGLIFRPAAEDTSEGGEDAHIETEEKQDSAVDETESRQDSEGAENEKNQNADGNGADEQKGGSSEEEINFWDMAVIGTPCVPAQAGWDMGNVRDVRDSFSALVYEPEKGAEDYTYLLAETDDFRLYGKGDYQTMLLENDGSYALILCEYMTSGSPNPPSICEADFDSDGSKELSIILNLLHGTGIYIDTFFVADKDEDGKLYVYQYLDDDYLAALRGHLSFKDTKEGTQPYVDGVEAGFPLFADEDGGLYDYVGIGDQVRFLASADSAGRGVLSAYAGIEFTTEESVISDYNSSSIRAEIEYGDGGHFALGDVGVFQDELADMLRYEAQDYYIQGFTNLDGTFFKYENSPANDVRVVEVDISELSVTQAQGSCKVLADGEMHCLNFLLKPYDAERISLVRGVGLFETVQVWETQDEETQSLRQKMEDFSDAYFNGGAKAVKEFLSASFGGNIEVYDNAKQIEKIDKREIMGLDGINGLEASEKYTLSQPFIVSGEDTLTYLSVTFISENGEWKVSGYGLEK